MTWNCVKNEINFSKFQRRKKQICREKIENNIYYGFWFEKMCTFEMLLIFDGKYIFHYFKWRQL